MTIHSAKTDKRKKTISREGLARILPWCLFAVFVFFVFITAQNVVQFGDDYCYTTFTSGGFDTFLSRNIDHWREVNGRAFVHIIDELLLWNGTIWLWRIFIVLCAGAAVLFSAAIASGAYRNGFNTAAFRISLCGAVCLFSALNIHILNQTVYWATGSLNYFFPCALFFVYAFLCLRLYEKTGRARAVWVLLAPLAFFCGAAIEQIGFGAFVFSCYIAASSLIKKKKFRILHYVNVLSSGLGCYLMFTAPGNAVRRTYYPDFYAMDQIARIKQNLPLLGYYLFGNKGVMAFVMLFAAGLFALSLSRAKNGKTPVLYRVCAAAVSAFAAFLFAVCAYAAAAGYREGDITSAYFLVPLAVCAAAEIIRATAEYFKAGSHAAVFWVLAAGLQAAMLLSPEMGPRTVLCSVMLIFVPLLEYLQKARKPGQKVFAAAVFALALAFCAQVGYVIPALFCAAFVFGAALVKLNKKSLKAPLPGVLALALGSLLALAQLDTVVSGYAENKPVHNANRALIEQYGNEGPLIQYYLINGDYRYVMPYDNSYHAYWYKRSTGLPEETEIIWKDYTAENITPESGAK